MSEEYNFPRMKFNVALLNGNFYLSRGELGKAEREYLKALSVKSHNNTRWLVMYNLGLTYLKNKNYQKSIKYFQASDLTVQDAKKPWSAYHQLFAHFKSKNYRKYLELEKNATIEGLDEELHWEIKFMKAASFVDVNRETDAITEFLSIWKENSRISAWTNAIMLLYENRQFDRIVQLVEQYPKAENNRIFEYKIKSLLGSQKFKEALIAVDKRNLTGDDLIGLRQEVWLANKMYAALISAVTPLLRDERDKEKRLAYYLRLGDSYFSLQKYIQSKNQFYKALDLVKTPEKRSPILYNIILATLLYKDYASFLKEITQALRSESLTPRIRYSLTIMLTDYHIKDNRNRVAEEILEQYTRKFEYQKTKMYNKQILLLYQDQRYQKCFKLAQEPINTENEFQRKDRIILSGYCGKTKNEALATIALVDEEKKAGEWKYRRDELNLVLSEAFFLSEQFENSNKTLEKIDQTKITPKQSMDTQFLSINNSLLLNESDIAEKKLGDVNQYRESNRYISALYLKAKIKESQKDVKLAIRTLLRLYYSPDIETVEKQAILLKISTIYLANRLTEKAAETLKMVNFDAVSKSPKLAEQYHLVKAQIEEANK